MKQHPPRTLRSRDASGSPARGRCGGARLAPAGEQGFTLVEVMLAAVAGALIFAAIFGIFSSAIHLRNRASEHVKDARMRLRAESIIRNDLMNAYISGATPGEALATILTGTQEAHGSSFPGYLQFTASTAELKDDQVGGDIQGIEYYIAKDPNAGSNTSGILVRTENRVLLAQTQMTPTEEPLLSGVNSLQISFYDGNNWDSTWSYVNQGDPLPEAIRMDIEFAPPQNGGPAPMPLEILVPWTTTPFTPVPATATTPATTQ